MQQSHQQFLSFVVTCFTVILYQLHALEDRLNQHSRDSASDSLARLFLASQIRVATGNGRNANAHGAELLQARAPCTRASLAHNSTAGLVVARNDVAKKAPSLLPAYDKVCKNMSDLQRINSYFSKFANFNFTIDDGEEIRRALEVAFLAHHGQLRKSGDLFVSHPVEAALILCQGGFDLSCVLAGLLHDTVEDTDLSFDEVENFFGETIRNIVEGETEASKLADKVRLPANSSGNFSQIVNPQNEQAENLRSLFVAIANDYRVIVVKLADRLHNMRTLEFMPRHKQLNKARETLELYVPLAQRFGLYFFKTELSDLAFKYMYPREDAKLSTYLQKNNEKYDETINIARAKLECIVNMDKSLQGRVNISYRIKDKYSIHQKMQRYNCELDDIYDVVAMRVVLNPKLRKHKKKKNNGNNKRKEKQDSALCYLILSKLHSIHPPLNGTFKDYIQVPKDNGYKSLHTTIRIQDQPIELQIRTHRMHDLAEYGAAAHANYKDSSMSEIWKNKIRHFQLDETSQFVHEMVKELNSTTVIVSLPGLPNGTYTTFPKGATVKRLREERGFHSSTHAVLVNGQVEKDTQALRHNDAIEFVRYEDLQFSKSEQEPSEDSLQFVVFGKDRPGLVEDIWKTITQREATIINLAPEVLEPEPGGPASIDITVELDDVEKEAELMRAIRAVDGVCNIRRGSIEQLLKESRESYWSNCFDAEPA